MQEAKSRLRILATIAAIALACIFSLGLAAPAEQAHAVSSTTTQVIRERIERQSSHARPSKQSIDSP